MRAVPDAVHIAGFKPRTLTQATSRVVNVSSKAIHIDQVIQPSCQLLHVDFTKNHVNLAPGMSQTFIVSFKSDSCDEIHDEFEVVASGERLKVPVHVYPVMERFDFPLRIDFGEIEIYQQATYSVPLINDADCDFEFELSVKQDDPSITVDPRSGVIHSGETVYVEIAYCPQAFVISTLDLDVYCSQYDFSPLHCTITGRSRPGMTKERLENFNQTRIQYAESKAAEASQQFSEKFDRFLTTNGKPNTYSDKLDASVTLGRTKSAARVRGAMDAPDPGLGLLAPTFHRFKQKQATREAIWRKEVQEAQINGTTELRRKAAAEKGVTHAEGCRFPANLNTSSAVRYVLSQRPGHFTVHDLHTAITQQKAVRGETLEAKSQVDGAEAGNAKAGLLDVHDMYAMCDEIKRNSIAYGIWKCQVAVQAEARRKFGCASFDPDDLLSQVRNTPLNVVHSLDRATDKYFQMNVDKQDSLPALDKPASHAAPDEQSDLQLRKMSFADEIRRLKRAERDRVYASIESWIGEDPPSENEISALRQLRNTLESLESLLLDRAFYRNRRVIPMRPVRSTAGISAFKQNTVISQDGQHLGLPAIATVDHECAPVNDLSDKPTRHSWSMRITQIRRLRDIFSRCVIRQRANRRLAVLQKKILHGVGGASSGKSSSRIGLEVSSQKTWLFALHHSVRPSVIDGGGKTGRVDSQTRHNAWLHLGKRLHARVSQGVYPAQPLAHTGDLLRLSNQVDLRSYGLRTLVQHVGSLVSKHEAAAARTSAHTALLHGVRPSRISTTAPRLETATLSDLPRYEEKGIAFMRGIKAIGKNGSQDHLSISRTTELGSLVESQHYLKTAIKVLHNYLDNTFSTGNGSNLPLAAPSFGLNPFDFTRTVFRRSDCLMLRTPVVPAFSSYLPTHDFCQLRSGAHDEDPLVWNIRDGIPSSSSMASGWNQAFADAWMSEFRDDLRLKACLAAQRKSHLINQMSTLSAQTGLQLMSSSKPSHDLSIPDTVELALISQQLRAPFHLSQVNINDMDSSVAYVKLLQQPFPPRTSLYYPLATTGLKRLLCRSSKKNNSNSLAHASSIASRQGPYEAISRIFSSSENLNMRTFGASRLRARLRHQRSAADHDICFYDRATLHGLEEHSASDDGYGQHPSVKMLGMASVDVSSVGQNPSGFFLRSSFLRPASESDIHYDMVAPSFDLNYILDFVPDYSVADELLVMISGRPSRAFLAADIANNKAYATKNAKAGNAPPDWEPHTDVSAELQRLIRLHGDCGIAWSIFSQSADTQLEISTQQMISAYLNCRGVNKRGFTGFARELPGFIPLAVSEEYRGVDGSLQSELIPSVHRSASDRKNSSEVSRLRFAKDAKIQTKPGDLSGLDSEVGIMTPSSVGAEENIGNVVGLKKPFVDEETCVDDSAIDESNGHVCKDRQGLPLPILERFAADPGYNTMYTYFAHADFTMSDFDDVLDTNSSDIIRPDTNVLEPHSVHMYGGLRSSNGKWKVEWDKEDSYNIENNYDSDVGTSSVDWSPRAGWELLGILPDSSGATLGKSSKGTLNGKKSKALGQKSKKLDDKPPTDAGATEKKISPSALWDAAIEQFPEISLALQRAPLFKESSISKSSSANTTDGGNNSPKQHNSKNETSGDASIKPKFIVPLRTQERMSGCFADVHTAPLEVLCPVLYELPTAYPQLSSVPCFIKDSSDHSRYAWIPDLQEGPTAWDSLSDDSESDLEELMEDDAFVTVQGTKRPVTPFDLEREFGPITDRASFVEDYTHNLISKFKNQGALDLPRNNNVKPSAKSSQDPVKIDNSSSSISLASVWADVKRYADKKNEAVYEFLTQACRLDLSAMSSACLRSYNIPFDLTYMLGIKVAPKTDEAQRFSIDISILDDTDGERFQACFLEPTPQEKIRWLCSLRTDARTRDLVSHTCLNHTYSNSILVGDFEKACCVIDASNWLRNRWNLTTEVDHFKRLTEMTLDEVQSLCATQPFSHAPTDEGGLMWVSHLVQQNPLTAHEISSKNDDMIQKAADFNLYSDWN